MELGQWGEAPENCEAWINQSNCIPSTSVFSGDVEHISIAGYNRHDVIAAKSRLPVRTHKQSCDLKHYWRYRMHITLEDLLKEKDFNEEIRKIRGGERSMKLRYWSYQPTI